MATVSVPPIDALRQAVLADEILHAELGAEVALDPFLDRCAAVAVRLGLGLGRGEVARALEPHAHSAVLLPPPPRLVGLPPRQWLPTEVILGAGESLIEWLHFDAAPLAEPFYSQATLRARARPINRLMRFGTSARGLSDFPAEAAPDGFVLHMSHCGSTLVAQMLAAGADWRSLSEPAPLDGVLRLVLAGHAPREAIRGVVGALTRDRDGATRRRFVKLNSWHALLLPLLRELFPRTPWVFLYRDPVEVLVTQMERPALELVPGVLPPGVLGPEAAELSGVEHTAYVIGRIVDAAVAALDAGNGLAVEYRQLPAAVETAILPHFAVVPDDQTRARMAAASAANAKRPQRHFIADSAAKQAEASSALRGIAERYIGPAFRRLQAIG